MTDCILHLGLFISAADGSEDGALSLAAFNGVQPGVGRHTSSLLPALRPDLRHEVRGGEGRIEDTQ